MQPRRRGTRAGIGLIVVLLVGSLGPPSGGAPAAASAPADAVKVGVPAIENASLPGPPAVRVPVPEGNVERVVLLPDGRGWASTLGDASPARNLALRSSDGTWTSTPATLPSECAAGGVVTGAGAAAWWGYSHLCRVSLTGVVTVVPVGVGTNPAMLAADPDGSLWLVGDDEVLHVLPDGTTASVEVATGTWPDPGVVAMGPDGRPWLAAHTDTGSQVSRIEADGSTTSVAVTDRRVTSMRDRGDGVMWVALAHGCVSANSPCTFPLLAVAADGERDLVADVPFDYSGFGRVDSSKAMVAGDRVWFVAGSEERGVIGVRSDGDVERVPLHVADGIDLSIDLVGAPDGHLAGLSSGILTGVKALWTLSGSPALRLDLDPRSAGGDPLAGEADVYAVRYEACGCGGALFRNITPVPVATVVVDGGGDDEVLLPWFQQAYADFTSATWYAVAVVFRPTSDAPGVQARLPAPTFPKHTIGQRGILRAYRTLLGTDPDAAGWAYWAGRVDDGEAYEKVLFDLVSTKAYRRRLIDATYRRVLGRPADPASISFWQDKLAAGAGRAEILVSLTSSAEFERKGDWRVNIYPALLGRKHDVPGAQWAGQAVQQGRTKSWVALVLLTSEEGRRARISALAVEAGATSGAWWAKDPALRARLSISGRADDRLLAQFARGLLT